LTNKLWNVKDLSPIFICTILLVLLIDSLGGTAGLEFELHLVDLGIRLHKNSHLFRPFFQMTPCGNWVTTLGDNSQC
jgi:hypothetical protein